MAAARGDPDNNGQNPDTWLGKILRIDVVARRFPGRPHAQLRRSRPAIRSRRGGGAPEVWALGLRNPFRASFDFGPRHGRRRLIIGDVGEDTVEEIDVMLGPTDNRA